MNEEIKKLIIRQTWWILHSSTSLGTGDLINLATINMINIILKEDNSILYNILELNEFPDESSIDYERNIRIPNELSALYDVAHRFISRYEEKHDIPTEFISTMIKELKDKDLFKENEFILKNIQKTIIKEYIIANKTTDASNIPNFRYPAECLHFAGYLIKMAISKANDSVYMNTLFHGNPLSESVELSFIDTARVVYDSIYRNAIYPKSKIRKSTSSPDINTTNTTSTPITDLKEISVKRIPRPSSNVSEHRRHAAMKRVLTEQEKPIFPPTDLINKSHGPHGHRHTMNADVMLSSLSIEKNESHVYRNSSAEPVKKSTEEKIKKLTRKTSKSISITKRENNIPSLDLNSLNTDVTSIDLTNKKKWKKTKPSPRSVPKQENKLSWLDTQTWEDLHSKLSDDNSTIFSPRADISINSFSVQLAIGYDIITHIFDEIKYKSVNLITRTDIDKFIDEYKAPTEMFNNINNMFKITDNILFIIANNNLLRKKYCLSSFPKILHYIFNNELDNINSDALNYMKKCNISSDKNIDRSILLSIIGKLLIKLREERDNAELLALSLDFDSQYEQWDKKDILDNTINILTQYSQTIWKMFLGNPSEITSQNRNNSIDNFNSLDMSKSIQKENPSYFSTETTSDDFPADAETAETTLDDFSFHFPTETTSSNISSIFSEEKIQEDFPIIIKNKRTILPKF